MRNSLIYIIIVLLIVLFITYFVTRSRKTIISHFTPTNDKLVDFIEQTRLTYNIKALIMGISVGDNYRSIVSGQSMSSVPATKDMTFRTGGQIIPALTTICLLLINQGIFRLEDNVAMYLPRVPNGSNITIQMLMNMTANLPDYITVPDVLNILLEQPFKQWSTIELLNIVYQLKPEEWEAGSRFNFAHMTNMLILGQIMEQRTGKTVAELFENFIVVPLQLESTQYRSDQLIMEPVLHSFDNMRIENYEDATYWNPSWGAYATAINSNVKDINKMGRALGSGSLLPPQLTALQTSIQPGTLITNNEQPYYGLGMGIGTFGTTYQTRFSNQTFGGYQGIWVYIPELDFCINFQINTVDQNGSLTTNQLITDLFKTFGLEYFISFAQGRI